MSYICNSCERKIIITPEDLIEYGNEEEYIIDCIQCKKPICDECCGYRWPHYDDYCYKCWPFDPKRDLLPPYIKV
jgi:hypothetical protein